MKQYTYILFLDLLMLILFNNSCQGRNSVPKKALSEVETSISTYKIKYRTTFNQPQAQSSSMMTQWVDKPHQRYAIFTITSNLINGKLHEVSSLMLSTNNWSYMINLSEKSGFKTKTDPSIGPLIPHLQPEDEESFLQMIKNDHGKVIGRQWCFNRLCNVVELADFTITGHQQVVSICYYKGIPLRISNANFTMEAVEFEENIAIESTVFEVPYGIHWTEISNLK